MHNYIPVDHHWQGPQVVCVWFEVIFNATVDTFSSSIGWIYRFVFIFIRALFYIILLKWQNGNGFLFCIVNGKILLLLDSLYNYIFFRPKSIWLSLIWKMIYNLLWVFVWEHFCMTDLGFFSMMLILSHKKFFKGFKYSTCRVVLVLCVSLSKLRNVNKINLNYWTTYFILF